LGAITFNPVLDRVAIFTLLGRNPDLYRLLTDADDDQEAVEVTVRNRNYTGRALRHLDLPGGLLVLGIRREGEFLVPHGNTQLHPGDRLTLLGSMQAVKQARRTIASVGDR
jgi:CPA2 family monovalent cation:H+ antiporter-2